MSELLKIQTFSINSIYLKAFGIRRINDFLLLTLNVMLYNVAVQMECVFDNDTKDLRAHTFISFSYAHVCGSLLVCAKDAH